ncbi:sigma-54-dependent transcriptional regulator [Clostridium aminobutyricum]|uniref:Stage 0 sporulation protein A homolog n=1 Tax=Clostridium aminobutyricum TaxID=33953 RepID=A0A939IGP6_CLOAM|nr:sigma-54 dependent transcriptional regulator [Clostridium aminobutyricum]MBN7773650.1 sigma-54-dependent Fis family transcriptional regulator [Clostridium aminobutyricum]
MVELINILVVDDELNVRQLLSKVLTKEGYRVYTACDGIEGLELLQTISIDIIISDIKMPRMSGIEFLHKVKEIEPDIGFILITAFATTETAIEALKSGAQDYVTKPFDFAEILTAVKKLSITNQHGYNYNFKQENENFETSSNSPTMIDILQLAKQVAGSGSTVLLTGETGTGKEVIASAIHRWSPRRDKSLIKVNCGAIPDNLLESELFGYEKGAFTGAVSSKPGRFEFADGGTIFLDEIGDISPSLQVKLLRVLQQKSFERLGGLKTIVADVRVIAATNKNLFEEVKQKRFREDLYYRLNVVPIHLPPLRERPEDIENLINYFLENSANISGINAPKIMSADALDCLKNYYWPGNIRELENIIERCVVISSGSIIHVNCLPIEIRESNMDFAVNQENETMLNAAIDNREKEVILKAIQENNGNKTKAALALGISRRSLHRKLQKYDMVD